MHHRFIPLNDLSRLVPPLGLGPAASGAGCAALQPGSGTVSAVPAALVMRLSHKTFPRLIDFLVDLQQAGLHLRKDFGQGLAQIVPFYGNLPEQFIGQYVPEFRPLQHTEYGRYL